MTEEQRRVTSTGMPSGTSRYAGVVEALGVDSDVAHETRKGFGSGALKVNGKIFAMVSSRGQFVVKLPRTRVLQLIAECQGECYDPGHGRIMKEWIAIGPDVEDWIGLAKEAKAYVER